MSRKQEPQETIDLIAAEWVARMLDGDLSSVEHEALNIWLNAANAHQKAFIAANDALELMDKAAPNSHAVPLPQGQSNPTSTSIHRIEPKPKAYSPKTDRAKSSPKRVWPYAALPASLLLALVSTRIMVGDPILLVTADYQTSVGEVRTVTLQDGSIVTLGPESAIAMAYTSQVRQVDLLSGLADFQAIPKEDAGGRPFVVSTTNGTTRALGTRFVVDKFENYATVTVLEHKVEVNLSHSITPKKVTIVSENQFVRYNQRTVGNVSTINPIHALSWQKGKLIFDRVTLREVVAEFSRYQRGKIMIANESVARKRVSGVFDMSTPQAGLELIATELNVRKISLPPLLTVLY